MSAQMLKEAFLATNPVQPLSGDDSRYVNCDKVRGEEVTTKLKRLLQWSKGAGPLHLVFTGHRGCGKSTELYRLMKEIEDEYFIVYFEATDDLDINDVEYTDIFLAVMKRVEQTVHDKGLALNSRLLENITGWFAEVIYEKEISGKTDLQTSLEASLGTPKLWSPFASLSAKILGQIKTGTSTKESIRRQIEPKLSQLIENINLLLTNARIQTDKDLLIIIDNLDRITPERSENIFLEHGEQLRALEANIIYTVPISLFYTLRANLLRANFPDGDILPMIRINKKDNSPDREGRESLKEIVGKRVSLDLFEPEALDELIENCGGCIRDLLRLIRYCCQTADEEEMPPITEKVAESAVRKMMNEMDRQLPQDYYPKLARVHHKKSAPNDPDHQNMLFNLSILEYNGEERWQDIHPVLKMTPSFKEAWENETKLQE